MSNLVLHQCAALHCMIAPPVNRRVSSPTWALPQQVCIRMTLFCMCCDQVRHIIYHKGLENEFDIVSPTAVGGLGSEQYKALNPQGKMPLLLLPNGQALPESEVRAAVAVQVARLQHACSVSADCAAHPHAGTAVSTAQHGPATPWQGGGGGQDLRAMWHIHSALVRQ